MIHAFALFALLAFPALVIAAALKDLTSYTIPNWISLALIAAFPVAALLGGLSMAQIGAQALVFAAALVGAMAMFAAGWIGGGDAKLFAAAAIWLGWPAVMTYVFVTALAGGGLAVGLLALRSARLKPHMPGGPAWFARLVQPGENVPYGVAIALGGLVAFPLSRLVAGH